jgi:hypothetical protein
MAGVVFQKPTFVCQDQYWKISDVDLTPRWVCSYVYFSYVQDEDMLSRTDI